MVSGPAFSNQLKVCLDELYLMHRCEMSEVAVG